jgi:enoyl-CoA hydratase
MIHIDWQDTVALVRMEHGKANAFDVDLSIGLRDELSALERSAAAIVLTGTAGIFSAGVDLFKVLDGGEDYLDSFLPALGEVLLAVFEWPRPVVAAINGHAIAGGCILACACDYRVMAEGPGRIGVPELSVGVPFPTAALEILRYAVPSVALQRLIFSGRVCPADEGLEVGLVDEVVGDDLLIARALEVAAKLAAVPGRSFEVAKRMLRRPTLERIRELAPGADGDVLEAWRQPESQAAIRAHLDRSIRRMR